MMIILFIICLLFLLESNPIYTLIHFILILIIIAYDLHNLNLQYISYVLIVVYLSALIILFLFAKVTDKEFKTSKIRSIIERVLISSIFTMICYNQYDKMLNPKLLHNFKPSSDGYLKPTKGEYIDNVKSVGEYMYKNATGYLFIMLIILYVAIVGILQLFKPKLN